MRYRRAADNGYVLPLSPAKSPAYGMRENDRNGNNYKNRAQTALVVLSGVVAFLVVCMFLLRGDSNLALPAGMKLDGCDYSFRVKTKTKGGQQRQHPLLRIPEDKDIKAVLSG